MKNLWIVLLLAAFVACGTPAPESAEPEAAEYAAAEIANTEDLEADEGEDEGEIELPPEGALPKSEILAKLEALGYTGIVETEFEDGAWEVEYVVDGEEHEFRVDPMTGEILPEEAEGE